MKKAIFFAALTMGAVLFTFTACQEKDLRVRDSDETADFLLRVFAVVIRAVSGQRFQVGLRQFPEDLRMGAGDVVALE